VTRMTNKILESRVVQNDETPVKVQDHEGKGIKTGRLWDFVGDHDHPYVVYRYTEDRSGIGPAEFFEDYEGCLQADAASVFERLCSSGKIIEVGCLMHARRIEELLPDRWQALRQAGAKAQD
jgi:transposase